MKRKINDSKIGPTNTISTSLSAADELAKLATLHEQGILSDQEFVDAKQKILEKM